jgi:hypothetical protein
VTTAPAPTMAFSPMFIPGRIVAFAPIEARGLMMVMANFSEFLASRKSIVGKRTFGPMNTSSPDFQSVPQLNAALNSDSVSYYDVVLYKDVITNITILSYSGTR